jgi:hypothetical protein
MKTCFKCFQFLPLGEFYKHSKMADGRLGKCKACARRDASEIVAKRRLNPDWLKAERQRCRNKSAKRRAAGLVKYYGNKSSRHWQSINPQKRKAHGIAARAQKRGILIAPKCCESCGVIVNADAQREEIKPCKCGNKPTRVRRYPHYDKGCKIPDAYDWRCGCEICYECGEFTRSRSAAIAAWNKLTAGD